jgi:hypothetical protein
MARHETQAQPAPSPQRPSPYPAEKARGGRIVLDTRARRMIFIAGLAGGIIVALLLGLLAATA